MVYQRGGKSRGFRGGNSNFRNNNARGSGRHYDRGFDSEGYESAGSEASRGRNDYYNGNSQAPRGGRVRSVSRSAFATASETPSPAPPSAAPSLLSGACPVASLLRDHLLSRCRWRRDDHRNRRQGHGQPGASVASSVSCGLRGEGRTRDYGISDQERCLALALSRLLWPRPPATCLALWLGAYAASLP